MDLSCCFICQRKFTPPECSSPSSLHLVDADSACEFLCKLFNLPFNHLEKFGWNEIISQCELCSACGEIVHNARTIQEEIKSLELKVQMIKDELRECIVSANNSQIRSNNCNDSLPPVSPVHKFLFQCLSKCEVRLTPLIETELRNHLGSNGAPNRSAANWHQDEEGQEPVEPFDSLDVEERDELPDDNVNFKGTACEDYHMTEQVLQNVQTEVIVEEDGDANKKSKSNEGSKIPIPSLLTGIIQDRGRGRPRLPPDHRQPKNQKNTYPCRHCKKTFKLQRLLGKHLAKAHNDQLFSVCRFCGMNFLEQRRDPAVLDTTNAPITTTAISGRVADVPTPNSYKKSSEFVYVCGLDGCKLTYDTLSKFRIHHYAKCLAKPSVQATRLARQFHCPQCEKTYSKSTELKYHFATVHEKKYRYCCEICGKGYQHLSHLTRHSASHSDELNFTCEECGKGFKGRDRLVHHQRRHKGERPYVCEVCGKGFHLSTKLNRHREGVHGEAKYPCEICGATFRTSDYRRQHLRFTHLGEKKNQRRRKEKKDQPGDSFGAPRIANANAADLIPQVNPTIAWEQYQNAL